MADERIENSHIDSRFDELVDKMDGVQKFVRAEISRVEAKVDRNHDDADERFRALEARKEGHSNDEIGQMIDERLEHFAANILPNVIRKAVHDELAVPLKTLEENTEELKKLEPLIKTVETGSNIRSALLWAVPLASAVVVIAAALTIAQAVAS